MISSRFYRVDHRDIIEYLPLGRYDEVNLIFNSTFRAQSGRLPMLMLSEEGVHHKDGPSDSGVKLGNQNVQLAAHPSSR